MITLGAVAALYVTFVILFEAVFLGYFQPRLESTGIPMLVITTTDDSGETESRRLARLETDGKIFVSAHHWPRGRTRSMMGFPPERDILRLEPSR